MQANDKTATSVLNFSQVAQSLGLYRIYCALFLKEHFYILCFVCLK